MNYLISVIFWYRAKKIKGEFLTLAEKRILKGLNERFWETYPEFRETLAEANKKALEIRKNIINASKKLKMYGKDMPIIARFDEYGNELPSEIRLCGESGITLVILDPEVNGKLYLELVAKEFPSEDYKQIWQAEPETIDATYLDDEYFHVKPLKITEDPSVFEEFTKVPSSTWMAMSGPDNE